MVDNSAMCGALDSDFYDGASHRLSALKPSKKVLWMANGTLTPSWGVWKGMIEFGGRQEEGKLEVFPSRGGWAMLFGKPLLEKFQMLYNYVHDVIVLKDSNGQDIHVQNQHRWEGKAELAFLNWLTADLLSLADEMSEETAVPEELAPVAVDIILPKEDNIPPPIALGLSRKVTIEDIADEDDAPSPNAIDPDEDLRQYPTWGIFPVAFGELSKLSTDKPTMTETPIWTTEDEPGAEQPDGELNDEDLFSRTTDPFKPARVKRILDLIQIGDDLTIEQRREIVSIIAAHADIFALSVAEVTPVKGAVLRLRIPEGAMFSKKVRQHSLKAPEHDYYYPRLNKLERCGVICKIAPEDVKCVSPTMLAQKPHMNQGLTIKEIWRILNKECKDTGLPAEFPEEEGKLPPPAKARLHWKAAAYRVCQVYGELNKLTQVALMPQGDIRTKQQKLCGERWISLFDFAAGFYAVTIDEESQLYTVFYVEGRGYYCYCKMPFGLMGAPSCFAKMTADALGDMVGRLIELFVDDGGMAGSDFRTKLTNLTTFFERCRATGLSLSAQKTEQFVSEAIFAGERVVLEGVRGDLAKLTAVANWEQPQNIQHLKSFLRLTGYFCSLIKDYAKIERPLKDLKAKCFKAPVHGGRQAYKQAAVACSLKQ